MKNITLKSLLAIAIIGNSFAVDPEITLSKNSVDVTSSDQTIGFQTVPSGAYVQIEFRQDPQQGVAALWGWVSSDNVPKIEIPKGTYPGNWSVYEVTYYNGGYRELYSANAIVNYSHALTDSMKALSINVTNAKPDTVPPAVIAFDIDMKKLKKRT